MDKYNEQFCNGFFSGDADNRNNSTVSDDLSAD